MSFSECKYFGRLFLFTPLLPLLYFQAISVRNSIPKLPGAKGKRGVAGTGENGKFKLITIGESTVAGVGVETHEEGFTGTLAKELATKLKVEVTWKVYAKSGFTAKKVTSCIIPNIDDDSVDLIVVGLGGNDAFKLNNPRIWGQNISNLINAIKGKFGDTPIIFGSLPPIKEFPAFTTLMKLIIGNHVEVLGDELDNLVKDMDNVYYYARRVTLTDWANRLNVVGSPEDFFSDGVHPSKLTYQVSAIDLVRYLMSDHRLWNSLKQN